jgi:electron transfer flavoprotein beta subunit
MNIVVCVKQVPQSDTVRFDRETGVLLREGVKSVINPCDYNAIEAALSLREGCGGRVFAITMGPPQAAEAIREALTMGVDEGVVLCDRAFAGADTLATTYTLAMAIRKIGDVDVVLCGKESVDGETGQVGPGLAARLNMPCIACAGDIGVSGNVLSVKRMYEWGYDLVEVEPPVVITAINGLNRPRVPSLKCMIRVRDMEIPVWNASDINADPARIGLGGSATKVDSTFVPEFDAKQEMIEGTPEEQADGLVKRLAESGIL